MPKSFYEDPTLQAQFDCLIAFTKGQTIQTQEHTWVPIAPGVVEHTYLDRKTVIEDAFVSALRAGRLLALAKAWGIKEL